MKVCICGGGNLAHAFVGELALNNNIDEVNILTRKPNLWNKKLEVYHSHEFHHNAEFNIVTDDKSILMDSNVIILTIPAHVRYEYLLTIKKYIKNDSLIIAAPSVGGIHILLEEYLPKVEYACLQRVPYVCRIKKYGQSVDVDIKDTVKVYFSKKCKLYNKNSLEKILNIKVQKLNSFWTLLLSNSNPIMHASRMLEILDDLYPASKNPLFYENWGNKASKLALAMDKELSLIMHKINAAEYCSLEKHYCINNYEELTKKINSIESFKNILSPMLNVKGKWILDSKSRYFIEDIPFGTCFIKFFAEKLNIDTPYINNAIEILQKIMGVELIKNNRLILNNWLNIIGFDENCSKHLINLI